MIYDCLYMISAANSSVQGMSVFLFHLFRDAPSLYILPRRVALYKCIHNGGVDNLQTLLGHDCSCDAVVPQDAIGEMLGKMTLPEPHEARKVEWICQ